MAGLFPLGWAHYLAGGAHLDVDALDLSCKHSSRMEKQAADAERASIRYKQAEYLLARIGQSFEGIISGLTNWGVYVELRENRCGSASRAGAGVARVAARSTGAATSAMPWGSRWKKPHAARTRRSASPRGRDL